MSIPVTPATDEEVERLRQHGNFGPAFAWKDELIARIDALKAERDAERARAERAEAVLLAALDEYEAGGGINCGPLLDLAREARAALSRKDGSST